MLTENSISEKALSGSPAGLCLLIALWCMFMDFGKLYTSSPPKHSGIFTGIVLNKMLFYIVNVWFLRT